MEHNPRTARRILAVARLAGVSRSDPATFNFSMKEPLFTLLREEGNPKRLVDHIWTVTKLRDKLGLYTTEVYAQSREDILNRQAQELLELSTPVVELWDKIILLPLIGMLDSERTQVVMENLLSQIVKCRADIAIVDISGVPTVDTLVAQHPHQDRLGRPPDGRRLHHKRHTPANRQDHRAPRVATRCCLQGNHGGRLRPRATAHAARRWQHCNGACRLPLSD
jgi:hypothetical protein